VLNETQISCPEYGCLESTPNDLDADVVDVADVNNVNDVVAEGEEEAGEQRPFSADVSVIQPPIS
jgi:hypothetical protein